MHVVFRSLLLLGGLTLTLTARPAAAQRLNQELAHPAAATAADPAGAPAELLRYLTNQLQLQPHQVLQLRRALAATDPATAAVAARELRQLLTPAQRTRLEQLRPESVAAAQVRLLALAR